MVGAAGGLTLGKQVSTLEGPVSVCAYLGKYLVMVRHQTGESATEFRLADEAPARQDLIPAIRMDVEDGSSRFD